MAGIEKEMLEAIIGVLEPVADCDWHGKWRIQRAIALARGGLEPTAPPKDNAAPYGYCPVKGCGAKGATREKRPDGFDQCARGHAYKSADAMPF